MENTNIALFELYHTHQMKDEDKQNFEIRLNQDKDFAQEWKIFSLLIEGISELEFKKKMTLLQEEIGVETNGFTETHIEEYIKNRLPQNLTVLLEQKMQEDSEFKQDIELRQQLVSEFIKNEEDKSFLSKIKGLQAEIAKEEKEDTPARIFRLSDYFRPMAMAASLLVAIAGGVWLYQNNQQNVAAVAAAEKQHQIERANAAAEMEKLSKTIQKDTTLTNTKIDTETNSENEIDLKKIRVALLDKEIYQDHKTKVNFAFSNTNDDLLSKEKVRLNKMLEFSVDEQIFLTHEWHFLRSAEERDKDISLQRKYLKSKLSALLKYKTENIKILERAKFFNNERTKDTLNDILYNKYKEENINLSPKIKVYETFNNDVNWQIALYRILLYNDKKTMREIAKDNDNEYQQKAVNFLNQ